MFGGVLLLPDTVCSLEARRSLLEPSHNHSAEAGRCGSLASQGALWLPPRCQAAALAAAATGDGRVTGLIDALSTAFALILAITGACAVLLLVAMVSAVSAVTG